MIFDVETVAALREMLAGDNSAWMYQAQRPEQGLLANFIRYGHTYFTPGYRLIGVGREETAKAFHENGFKVEGDGRSLKVSLP
jgi:hypothetical protein